MVLVEMRNGFGLDIEVASSRPVGISFEEDEPATLAYFEGWVLQVPFFTNLWGDVFTEMEE